MTRESGTISGLFAEGFLTLADGENYFAELRYASLPSTRRHWTVATQVPAKADKRLSKSAVKNEPLLNQWLRGIQRGVEQSDFPILKVGAGALAAIVVLGGAYFFYGYNRGNAEEAFSAALALYSAEVKDPKEAQGDKPNQPKPATTKKTFPDEKTKYTEALAAFERAAGYSSQSNMSRYYAALCRLHLDKDQGMKELEAIAVPPSGVVSQLAQAALADAYADKGDTQKAIDLYKKLQETQKAEGGATPILSPEIIAYTLGQLYESQGKAAEASQAYLDAAKAKGAPRVAQQAYERLTVLDPDLARKTPSPKPSEEDAL
jgi:tetratricopeptide (TPR) repeat protein